MSGFDRPAPEECAEFYHGYLAHVPDGPIFETLARQITDTVALLSGLSEERAGHRYAAGKWSVKQVVGHMADAERLFSFRALWFARRDPAPQPGMDQNAWVEAADFDRRPLPELIEDLQAVRHASLTLFSGFAPEIAERRGTASGYPFTLRSLPWILAGHELHHRHILATRYDLRG